MTKSVTIGTTEFMANGFEFSLLLLDLGDRTTTLDGVDHVETRKLKRSLRITLTDVDDTTMYNLLSEISAPYISVTYEDAKLQLETTKVFILQGNPVMPMKLWKNGLYYYESITIDLLEKGAE